VRRQTATDRPEPRLARVVEANKEHNMNMTLSRGLTSVIFAIFLCALFATPAGAGLVGTDQVADPQQSERERVKALIARPEVERKLETLGVLPKDAQTRVDALTDEEVRTLAARIDALPAAGMSDQNWILVVIAVLLVAILIAL
jgi:hypothetical protein